MKCQPLNFTLVERWLVSGIACCHIFLYTFWLFLLYFEPCFRKCAVRYGRDPGVFCDETGRIGLWWVEGQTLLRSGILRILEPLSILHRLSSLDKREPEVGAGPMVIAI